MKSPFPGMDPFLEQHWRDVHASLVLYSRNQIQPQLGPSMRARVEERLVVDSIYDDREQGLYPDVRVVERTGRAAAAPANASGIAVAEPFVIHLPNESHTEGYVEIIDTAAGHKVITVIEILSPTNKRPGKSRDEYRRKQQDLHDGGVSLVEIDLLRAGKRTLQVAEFNVPPEQRKLYAACVHRGYRLDRFEYYAMGLRDRLPAIRIPLRPDDRDAVLDIQALIDQAYMDGAYDDLDYSKPLVPPLAEEDRLWAEDLCLNVGKK